MEPSDLALCSTQELIQELVKRRTFLGVVLHAQGEVKQQDWDGERVFRVHFNENLTRDEVRRLLDRIAEHMLLDQNQN